MLLNLISIPNVQNMQIQLFALANDLEIITSPTTKVQSMEFEWLLLPSLLEAVPELGKRMWLFDGSEDVIDCAATYDSETDSVNLWFAVQFPDAAHSVEKSVPVKDFENMLGAARLAEFENGRMVREMEVGYGWGGEPNYIMQDFSVSEWVDEFGWNEKDVKKLFPGFVANYCEIIIEATIAELQHSKSFQK